MQKLWCLFQRKSSMAKWKYREVLLFYITKEIRNKISNKNFRTKIKKWKDKLGLLMMNRDEIGW